MTSKHVPAKAENTAHRREAHADEAPPAMASPEEYNAAEMAVRGVLAAMAVPFAQLGPEEQSELIRTMVHAALDAAAHARAGD